MRSDSFAVADLAVASGSEADASLAFPNQALAPGKDTLLHVTLS
jgi:hypothetical protein